MISVAMEPKFIVEMVTLPELGARDEDTMEQVRLRWPY